MTPAQRHQAIKERDEKIAAAKAKHKAARRKEWRDDAPNRRVLNPIPKHRFRS